LEKEVTANHVWYHTAFAGCYGCFFYIYIYIYMSIIIIIIVSYCLPACFLKVLSLIFYTLLLIYFAWPYLIILQPEVQLLSGGRRTIGGPFNEWLNVTGPRCWPSRSCRHWSLCLRSLLWY